LKTGASEADSAETDGAKDSDQTRSIPVRLQKGMCIAAVPGSRFSGHNDRTKKELNESARNFLRAQDRSQGAIKKVSEQGRVRRRGRLVPVKLRVTDKTRGRGRPRPFLDAPWTEVFTRTGLLRISFSLSHGLL